MKLRLEKSIKRASVYYKDNIAYEVNEEFLNFTGYTDDKIIGKSFEQLIKLLRADCQSCIGDIKDEFTCYIFTKEDKVKEVKITQKNLSEENERLYIIEENTSSLLKGILSTCANNKESIAIISYPEFIHLKVNKNYKINSELIDMNQDKPLGKSFLCPDYIVSSIQGETSSYKEKVEFIDNSGKTTYWTINSIMIFEEGQAKYLRCSFFDETEKVMTRKLLEKQKKEMEIILENIPDSIVKLNNKGEYTYTNKVNLEKLSPYKSSNKSLNNKEVYSFFKYNDINGNELSFYDTPDARVLRGEELKNYIVIGTSHLPTTYHECTGTPIYDEEGNIESAVLIYRDIEDNFKLEEYNSLVENIKHLEIKYATLSPIDFKIRYINENGFKAIKRGNSNINALIEVIGNRFFDFYNINTEEEMELIKNIEEAIENKSSYKHTQKFIEGKKVKYVKSVFQPVFDKDNKLKKINVIGMDITEEESINQNMTNALVAQEEIFINTSHELKTPLNLIFSASQLVGIYLKGESIKDKKHDIARNNQIITQNCYRLIKLVNNILDVSKIERGFYELNLDNGNIISAIESIVKSISKYIENMELSIVFDSEVEEKIMAFDLYKLERVMLNLISNAIKFSNPNGVILVNIVEKYDAIEISVSDNGIGIDKQDMSAIFSKFKQVNKSLNRKAEGTGIGLSLVKSIVDLHGGKISVESTLGLGSTFKIELPAKIVDNPLNNQEEYNHNDRIEMIKFELSDIYS